MKSVFALVLLGACSAFPADPCDICNTGDCAPCKQCVNFKTGPCEQCWAEVNGASCLPACEQCWPADEVKTIAAPVVIVAEVVKDDPCQTVCADDGVCGPCKQCLNNKYGPCDQCWAVSAAGTACLPSCQDDCWSKPPTPKPAPTAPTPASSPTPGGAPTCDICVGDGQCAACSQCTTMQTGPCAPCWADNNGFSCLPFCDTTCHWQPDPASPTPAGSPTPNSDPCTTVCADDGVCGPCKQCLYNKYGPCDQCWAVSAAGTACLPSCQDDCWSKAAVVVEAPVVEIVY